MPEEDFEVKQRNGHRKKPGKFLKSMGSLNPQEIDCCLEDFGRNKRMRGIRDVTSCEVVAVPAKDSKFNGGRGAAEESNQEAAASSSSSSSQSSRRTCEDRGRQIGKSDCEVEEENDVEVKSLACLSQGFISVIGRRRVMEDAVTVTESDFYRFFAVYDGHGGSGVASACRDRLHQLLEKEAQGRLCGCGGSMVEWEKVMRASFLKMNEEIYGAGIDEDGGARDMSSDTVGSTAVVVVVTKAVIVVGNCGDSRAVLCRDGAAVPLSRDHRPDRPDERERLEAAGGRIINWNGSRVLGVLAPSRSIGDHYLKPYVISEPEVTVSERTESDSFLVIASDGLWDVVSNEFACEVVRRCFEGQIRRQFSDGLAGSTAAEAAALLAELAMARGSKDNISVIVVDLKK